MTPEQRKERLVKAYLPTPMQTKMDKHRRPQESRSAFIKAAVAAEIERRSKKGGTTLVTANDELIIFEP